MHNIFDFFEDLGVLMLMFLMFDMILQFVSESSLLLHDFSPMRSVVSILLQFVNFDLTTLSIARRSIVFSML